MYSKGVRPFEGCEPAHIIVGIDEVVKVSVELLMALVIRAFDGGVLNRPVHAFNLAIRSGMLDLGEAVLDPTCVASHVEHMGTACLPSFGPRRCRYESSRWGMS
jgi:hypothetical protein